MRLKTVTQLLLQTNLQSVIERVGLKKQSINAPEVGVKGRPVYRENKALRRILRNYRIYPRVVPYQMHSARARIRDRERGARRKFPLDIEIPLHLVSSGRMRIRVPALVRRGPQQWKPLIWKAPLRNRRCASDLASLEERGRVCNLVKEVRQGENVKHSEPRPDGRFSIPKRIPCKADARLKVAERRVGLKKGTNRWFRVRHMEQGATPSVNLGDDRGHLVAQTQVYSEVAAQSHVVQDICAEYRLAQAIIGVAWGNRAVECEWFVGQKVGERIELPVAFFGGRRVLVQPDAFQVRANLDAVNALGDVKIVVSLNRGIPIGVSVVVSKPAGKSRNAPDSNQADIMTGNESQRGILQERIVHLRNDPM